MRWTLVGFSCLFSLLAHGCIFHQDLLSMLERLLRALVGVPSLLQARLRDVQCAAPFKTAARCANGFAMQAGDILLQQRMLTAERDARQERCIPEQGFSSSGWWFSS